MEQPEEYLDPDACFTEGERGRDGLGMTFVLFSHGYRGWRRCGWAPVLEAL